MADRMETDKDIRKMSLFDLFFFYAKINTKNEILEPSNFEDSKLFIIKFFVTRNSGIIRIMINLTYENLTFLKNI